MRGRGEGHALEQARQTVTKIRAELTEPGAVNFSYIHDRLQNAKLDTQERHELGMLAVQKVQSVMELGNFRDLQGAQPLLEMLGVSEMQLAPEWAQKIDAFLNRFTLSDINYLLPSLLISNRLPNGKPYDKVAFARERLLGAGVSPAEATDEFVKDVLKTRELLLKLYKTKAEKMIHEEAQKGLTVRKLLQIAEHASA